MKNTDRINRMKLSNRAATLLYIAVALYIMIKYLAAGNYMQAVLGPVSLLFLFIYPLAELILKIKIGPAMRCFITLFIILAFQTGTGLEWYVRNEYYSFFVHAISGIIFTQIGYFLYFIIRGKEDMDLKRDWLLKLTYALFFSMAIAVFWEICEYFTFIITGRDVQHTLDTGVHDTMLDLISCVAGSLMIAGNHLLYIWKNKRGFLMFIMEEFYKLNVR